MWHFSRISLHDQAGVAGQVLNAFLVGLLLFGETMSLLSICGSLLIAAGIITSSSSQPKAAKGNSDEEVPVPVHSRHCLRSCLSPTC